MKRLFVLFCNLFVLSLCLCAQINLDSGLVGCYPFNGNVNDYSGHGNNGILYNATPTTDRFGNLNSAYSFNQCCNTYISIPNFSNMCPTDDLSISIWTQSTSYTSTCPLVLISDSERNRLCACAEYVGGPWAIWDYGDILTTGRMEITSGPYVTSWQHYVFMVSQSQNIKKIYLNGTLLDSSVFTGNGITKNGRVLSIGGSLDWSHASLWWDGKLDDVRIYNRALTGAEVMALYNNTSSSLNLTKNRTGACSACNGTAYITATGCTGPLHYLWSNGDTTQFISGLCAGTYTLSISASCNCLTLTTDTINIPTAPDPSVNVPTTDVTNVNCYGGNDGMASAIGSGGTAPYNYVWLPSGYKGDTITNLPSGTYTVIVTDIHNCAGFNNFIVTQPSQLNPATGPTLYIEAGSNTVLSATATGGTSPYSFTWNSTISGQSIIVSPTITTIYTVEVTDRNGCTAKAFEDVEILCGDLFMPDAFSPNGDGNNDLLYVKGSCIRTMDLIIFDRWGNRIFETNDQSIPWDGTYKGLPMTTGTYPYYLTITTYKGDKVLKKGNITLVR